MRGLRISQSITDRQDMSLSLYFRDVSKIPLLTYEEEQELGQEAKARNEQAINKLVTSNLRFAISVAKQYQGKGMPLVDLVQAANIGLIEGARHFDPDKGVKFISYVVWWIRQAVVKALLGQGKTVRIPMSQLSNINKVNKVSEKFEQENGRIPSIDEIRDNSNLTFDKINSSINAISKSVSLDSPFKDDDVNCLLDVIPNKNSVASDLEVTNTYTHNEIVRILDSLNPRDCDIIKMFFGIGMPAMPNEKIANYFGIGAERVRQLTRDILKYLKKHYSKELKDLL